MEPKVGMTVNYNTGNDQPHAAIIAYVYPDGICNLMVIDPNGANYNKMHVPHGSSLYQWDYQEVKV